MTSSHIGQGTAQGLVDYLDMLIEKGRATNGAIQPLRTAFTKVVEAVDGKDWRQTKVEDIDINDYIDRFGNLTRGTYSNQSLTAYKSRAGRAIGWYLKFMNQAGWMPSIKARAPRQSSKPKQSPAPHNDLRQQPDSSQVQGYTPSTNAIEYPFPLQSGDIAKIFMPVSAKKADMKRLALFLDALVMDGGDHE